MLFFGEGAITQSGHRLVRMVNQPSKAVETFNRVWGFASGLRVGRAEGLSGKALRDRAGDISRFVNFGSGSS